jgi:hypothetical protein
MEHLPENKQQREHKQLENTTQTVRIIKASKKKM